MKKSVILILIIFFLSGFWTGDGLQGQGQASNVLSLTSPNNRLEVKIGLREQIAYSVYFDGSPIL
jgi:hypothetical protein